MRHGLLLFCAACLACASENSRMTDAQNVVPAGETALPSRGSGATEALDLADEADAPANDDASIANDASPPHDDTANAALDAVPDGAGLACDPVLDLGCPTSSKCAVNNTSSGAFIRCQSFGTQTARQTCTYAAAGDSCAQGLSCLSLVGDLKPICRRLCPWAARGTRPDICSSAPRGQCLPLITTYRIAYCD